MSCCSPSWRCTISPALFNTVITFEWMPPPLWSRLYLMPRSVASSSTTSGCLDRRLQLSRTTRKIIPTHSFLIMIFTLQPHLVCRDGLPRIPPTVADIGEHIGYLFIGQLHNGGHHAVISGPVDTDRSGRAAQHDTNTPCLIGHQEVRTREWRKDLRQALAIRLMTDCTGLHEHELTFFHLDFFGHGSNRRGLLDGLLDLFPQGSDTLGRRIAFWRLLPKVRFVHLPTGIHEFVVWPIDFQHSQGTLVKGAKDGMIDEHVGARRLELELYNGRPACRYQGRLDIFLPYRGATFSVDLVKNLPDNVERRHQVRATIAHEEADGFTHIRLQSIVAHQGIDGTV